MKALNLKSMLIAAVAATGLVAGSAMAGPTVDNFIKAYNSANSGKDTELGIFEDATGLDFSDGDLGKIDGNGGATFENGLWVINVGPLQPGYFLLKFGAGGTDTNLDTYVFKNGPELTQLVWSNELVNFLSGGACSTKGDNGKGKDKDNEGGNCNIGRLSHVSFVPGENGGGTPGGNPGEVPEPASLALLGAGLAGMALRRRRA